MYMWTTNILCFGQSTLEAWQGSLLRKRQRIGHWVSSENNDWVASWRKKADHCGIEMTLYAEWEQYFTVYSRPFWFHVFFPTFEDMWFGEFLHWCRNWFHNGMSHKGIITAQALLFSLVYFCGHILVLHQACSNSLGYKRGEQMLWNFHWGANVGWTYGACHLDTTCFE